MLDVAMESETNERGDGPLYSGILTSLCHQSGLRTSAKG